MKPERFPAWRSFRLRMVWQFQCPKNGCEFSKNRNDEPPLIEDAQQHMADSHGNMPTREDVEQYVVGP